MRKPESHRPHDVGSVSQQRFALCQGLSNQAEFVMLKIAKAAVNQFATAGGSGRCEIIHFTEQYFEASPSCIQCNARTINSASNHKYIVDILIVCHFLLSRNAQLVDQLHGRYESGFFYQVHDLFETALLKHCGVY